MEATYRITDSGVTVLFHGGHYTVAQDHPNYGKIVEKLRRKDTAGLQDLLDARSAVQRFLSADRAFTLEGDLVTLDGKSFGFAVTDKVLNLLNAGNDAEPLFAFLRKLRQNTYARAQERLLEFCVVNDFMIHRDGDILAYKAVRENYTDMHSGKFDNSVGKVVTMDRSEVDDDPERTCSFGLHFAAYEYAAGFGGNHLMIIKVNPADVVSIPVDYHNQKARCCRYEVVGEMTDRNRLPKKEVYEDSDFGRSGSQLDREHELANIEAEGYDAGQAFACDFDDETPVAIEEADFCGYSGEDAAAYADGFRNGYNDELAKQADKAVRRQRI